MAQNLAAASGSVSAACRNRSLHFLPREIAQHVQRIGPHRRIRVMAQRKQQFPRRLLGSLRQESHDQRSNL